MNQYMGDGPFVVTQNNTPKTEVALGLTNSTSEDGFELENMQCEGIPDLGELEREYMERAIELIGEQVDFLCAAVPRICGDVHPYQTGLERGFPQLLEQLESREKRKSALLHTIRNQANRFGQLHELSVAMALELWVGLTLMSTIDRQLAIIQDGLMK